MPRLNVTRVLFSREFVDRTLVCRRNAQTVGQDGRAVDTPTDTPFSGVVTNDQGDIMKRMPEGSYVTGSIMVHSKFPLIESDDTHDADLVNWKGRWYTVFNVSDWTTYGAGFTAAICTPTNLSGG